MTTVVIDCKNQKVYTDDLCTVTSWNNKVSLASFFLGIQQKDVEWESYIDKRVKAHVNDNCIITGCGNSRTINKFAESFPKDIPKATENTTVFVVYKKEGCTQIVQYKAVKKGKFSNRHKWKISTYVKSSGYVVAGSGSDFAYGALMTGVDPESAIKAAAKADTGTGTNISVYEFKKED